MEDQIKNGIGIPTEIWGVILIWDKLIVVRIKIMKLCSMQMVPHLKQFGLIMNQ